MSLTAHLLDALHRVGGLRVVGGIALIMLVGGSVERKVKDDPVPRAVANASGYS